MQIKNYAFGDLPFSKLFKTYVENFEDVADFYAVNPFSSDDLKNYAKSFTFRGDREQSASLLHSFNQQFDVDEATFKNIERLKQADSLAIVSGQQLGLYSGPVFTLLKAVTAIQRARQMEKLLNRPVIPVFWLADEDHDYEEIRSLSLLNNDLESFALPPRESDLPPVSELSLPDEIEELRSEIQGTLIDTEFSDELWTMLDQCFYSGATFLTAFGNFLARLFSKHGLVLAGSHHPAIKEQIKEPLITAVKKADDLHQNLERQSQHIEQKFHRQATVYDSHLFYIHPENGREKIQRSDEFWTTASGIKWTSADLTAKIESNPARFSPDVFLRPVLQDRLLPTLGYAAGPGELAYYGQMKSFYRCFDQQMPAILPRLSVTFIEPAIDRVLQELPFDIDEYNNRIEDLESAFVERTGEVDIEAIFDSWKAEEREVTSSHLETISSIDETLEGAVEKAQATYFNELNKLKGKVYKAVKKRKNIQLNRIHRIRQNLFPGGQLQERTICGIYYMNKFGPDIWDRLLDHLEEMTLNDHKLIYL